LLSDPRYNRTEFGKSREYWKGKLRAAAFAWAISEQFEIGPLSEASIGHIQAYFPQQGFVDHVITPTIGLAWMLGEDAVDRYVIRRIEDRTTNKWPRLAARTGLNPMRSFANLIDARAPWDRGSRSGILAYKPEHASGSASSGDALLYQIGRAGPQSRKWCPHAHLLVGGIKVTQEQLYPEKKIAVEAANKNLDPMLAYTLHDQYTSREESNGVALSAETGVDHKLNAGMVLQLGTW